MTPDAIQLEACKTSSVIPVQVRVSLTVHTNHLPGSIRAVRLAQYEHHTVDMIARDIVVLQASHATQSLDHKEQGTRRKREATATAQLLNAREAAVRQIRAAQEAMLRKVVMLPAYDQKAANKVSYLYIQGLSQQLMSTSFSRDSAAPRYRTQC